MNTETKQSTELLKAKLIIHDAVERIENMNFNGVQINTTNKNIITISKLVIKSNDYNSILNLIKLISKNENGFKWVSGKETIYSKNAKDFINTNN
jgi:hypothetical protein